jgi:copper ion binding protein
MVEKVLMIKGMSCGHCVARVEKALTSLDGVTAVKVSLEENSATIEYDESRTGTENFKSAVAEAGYEAAE